MANTIELDDENMYVLVVGSDEENVESEETGTISFEPAEVDDIIETAEKHGKYIYVDVKAEPLEYENEHISDDSLEKFDIKFIKDETESLDDFDDQDEEYNPPEKCTTDDEYEQFIERRKLSNRGPKKYLAKPEPKSLVEELRQEYAELRHDELKLVQTVEQIMREVRPPDPPRDYYIMNGIMFECVVCGNISSTIPAAHRHYNQKHGPRYLLCYACGDDFRCSINLYKHEKRCRAPDAHVVLKARALIVSSKGRGRPYLSLAKSQPFRLPLTDKTPKSNSYPCNLCSAVFTTKNNLQSHENLHRGERPYRCKGCPRAYTNLTALNRHAKMHTDQHFICDYCNRSFKSKPILKTHLQTHEPLRKYPCPECERRYSQNSALQRHVDRVHRNLPPPCACQICPKRYPRMSLLKEHMKKAHGLTLMTREMFFKMLPTMTEWEVKQTQMLFNPESFNTRPGRKGNT